MGWMDAAEKQTNVDLDLGSFWPKIGTLKFYEAYRPPSELPSVTVLEHLRHASIRVRHALKGWRREQTAESLAEVDQEMVDGIGEKVMLFERAVYCEAKAEILKETQTADRRTDAENTAKTGAETEEKYREFAADCINILVGDQRINAVSI